MLLSVKNQGITGAAIMAMGGFCPLLRVPVMGNWNYFDVDLRLASAFYILVLIGFVAAFLQKPSLLRFVGWAALFLVALSLAGIYFKVHDTFSFIRFKKLITLAAGTVKYKWGWYVIVLGALVLIALPRPKTVIKPT
jgi:hypothetical protein